MTPAARCPPWCLGDHPSGDDVHFTTVRIGQDDAYIEVAAYTFEDRTVAMLLLGPPSDDELLSRVLSFPLTDYDAAVLIDSARNVLD